MKRSQKTSRRTQAQRRHETQAAILSAAIKLLIKKGHIGFSASRVAAMAGVSRGAQEHYFPTKNDLLAAATRHAMREAVEHAGMLARRAMRSKDPIAKFLLDSEHFFFSPVYYAMVEILLAARSDAALSRVCFPIIEDARQVLNNIWIDTLRSAGYTAKNAQRFVELTHYLLRGIFLISAWAPYDVDRPSLVDTWRRLAPAILRLKASSPRKNRHKSSPSRRQKQGALLLT